ncbi:related to epoxide hydrolase [Fusarium fujikuroi]|nr:related to epoxide hydrolase [Fusarium fujikuroi]
MEDCFKLVPSDPRVATSASTVDGKSYSYIRAIPTSDPIQTIFLLHGFLDLSFGWRHQIPYLASIGYQVIALDLLGCGGSDKPHNLKNYTFKSVANDIKALAKSLVGEEQIILGGHGLGGAIVWRTAMWYPDLVLGIFSIAAPFLPPLTAFLAPDDPVLEFGPRALTVRDHSDKFHQWGGVELCGKINTTCGFRLLFRHLAKHRHSGTISRREYLLYTRQYLSQGKSRVEAALNWFHFQTRAYNQNEELRFSHKPVFFTMPALYISASQESKVTMDMIQAMSRYFEALQCRVIFGSHWCIWEAANDINKQLGDWLASLAKSSGQLHE